VSGSARGDLESSPRHDRGSHVEHEGRHALDGRGKGNGIRADLRHTSTRWHDKGVAIGERDTDLVMFQGHHREVVRDAVVVGMAHGNHAEVVLSRLPDRHLHGPGACRMAHPVVRVENGSARAFPDHVGGRPRVNGALVDHCDVPIQSRHATQGDAAHVRCNQDPCGGFGVRRSESDGAQDGGRQRLQGIHVHANVRYVV
jgi:hypothetical protein